MEKDRIQLQLQLKIHLIVLPLEKPNLNKSINQSTMSDNGEPVPAEPVVPVEQPKPTFTGVIGRGESIITKKHPDADDEAANSDELNKNEELEIEGIKESQGWLFPKVKLSTWVSTVV